MRIKLGNMTSRLRYLAAAAALAVGGLGVQATGAEAATFKVANPYAYGLGDDQIAIRTLNAFGDSFTAYSRRPFDNWAELLADTPNTKGADEVLNLAGFPKSGASAGKYGRINNNFISQVNLWLGTEPRVAKNDLTVVYLGNNDILNNNDPTGADLSDPSNPTNAERTYTAQLKRIEGVVAGTGGSRILLVMSHNLGRSPLFKKAGAKTMRQRTVVWNKFVARTAQNFSKTYGNLIAVDLYTTFERVYTDPGAFCFSNVTDPLPSGGDPDKYLYDTEAAGGQIHFGAHGQELIEQVIQYYLTRGWDWANTYKTPSTAKQKLNAALDAGNVFTPEQCQATGLVASARAHTLLAATP